MATLHLRLEGNSCTQKYLKGRHTLGLVQRQQEGKRGHGGCNVGIKHAGCQVECAALKFIFPSV